MLQKLELIFWLLIVAGFVSLNGNLVKMAASENVEKKELTVVLDPGHGGVDPGKIGINDVLEKDINLQIAKKVRDILEEKDITVIMTRETDTMIGDSQENTKKEDMQERVDIINNAEPDIAVSIHQNSYTDPSVSGAQVFYHSESEEGKKFALIMQKELLAIDVNNHRQAKENNNYYMLTRTKVPVIIVECGFLSNQEEAEKLATEEYQDEISNAIVGGIESCFSK